MKGTNGALCHLRQLYLVAALSIWFPIYDLLSPSHTVLVPLKLHSRQPEL